MSPDEFQEAWQSHGSGTRVTVDADTLLSVVLRNQGELRTTSFWNEFTGLGIALVMLPTWIVLGVVTASPWTWYLMVPVLIWHAGFSLIARARRKRTQTDAGEPLLRSVRESLALVEEQIWYLRGVTWWCHLPMAIAMLAFFVRVIFLGSDSWLEFIGEAGTSLTVVFLIFAFIFYVSYHVIRSQHEPRRQELLALLASLSDDTTSEVPGAYPILMRTKLHSRRKTIAAILCALVLGATGVGGIYVGWRMDDEYPKKSPFEAVRWEDDQPEVQVDGEWFRLVSLDGIPATEILDFSKRTYEELWQKRFEEDLVELLTRMGYPPKNRVTLVVESLTSSEVRTLENVRMTRAHRRAIWNAAQERSREQPDE